MSDLIERRFVHYSKEPLLEMRSVDQRAEPYDKPRGLWISVEGEDDWKAWCEAESFATERLANETEIVLAEDASILRLSGAAEIDAFHHEYKVAISPRIPDYFCIDWFAVAERYQGIIIAPYVWSRRLEGEARWYYGWDCASGCIWDARAVEALKARSTKEPG